jgi:cation:H+ antiporter
MISVVNMSGIALSLGMVVVAMYVIKFACDAFEDASDYLGTEVYKMAPGVRGATLEAIASSLPELFTTLFLLFVFHDEGGFAAGVATCAGSAVFNAVIIPAVCILTVTLKGVNGTLVDRLHIQRRTILRDGFFFVLAELCLIFFLGTDQLVWWMGLVLMALYGVYFAFLMRSMGVDREEDSEEDSDEDADEAPSIFKAVLTFDFNHLLFQGQNFSPGRAWTVLGCATSTIAAACYLLSESVMLSADALDVQPYFTAVILGAAATSVPDTVLSYKDAIKGDYDDAVANAIGSNIFDICVALGLPLAIYSGLNVLQGNSGSIPLVSAEGAGEDSVQDLRIVLVILSVVIIGTFLSANNERDEEGRSLLLIGKGHGWALLGIYLIWTGFVVSQMVG